MKSEYYQSRTIGLAHIKSERKTNCLDFIPKGGYDTCTELVAIHNTKNTGAFMKFISFFLTALIIMSVDAVENFDGNAPKPGKDLVKILNKVEEGNCLVDENLRDKLCLSIDSQAMEDKPLGRYRYTYQRLLIENSCVKNIDDKEEVKDKISKFWNEHENEFHCTMPKFGVTNGNPIKFASNLLFDAFIYDMSRWEINLNKIDEYDNKTVLDYIKDEIARNKGTAIEPKLQSYYDKLRKAGAKHKSEL